MIAGVGCDIIDIDRIRKAIEANPRFVDKLFTEREIAYCTSRAKPFESYAARFAAKEAVMKALGTGWDGIVNWQDIEVISSENSRPTITLYNGAKALADKLGISNIQLSISHEKEHALAFAVLETQQ